MKKVKRIFIIIILFIFLSSPIPKNSQNFNSHISDFFGVEFIEVVNNNLIEDFFIKEKLKSIYNTNILFLKKKEIKHILSNIDFIDYFELKKILPNKVILKIYEEEPIAIFNNKEGKFFITSANHLVDFKEIEKFNNIPNVFGVDADKEFVNFYNLLKKKSFPIKQVKEFYFFKINRWDLYLNNGKIIKLPPAITVNIIDDVKMLLENNYFKTKNILDLRIDNRIITQ